jgi:hypothetical protein
MGGVGQGGGEHLLFRASQTVIDELMAKIDGFVKSPSAALRCIPCPVKLKTAISRDMGYRSCLKTVTSNKENI